MATPDEYAMCPDPSACIEATLQDDPARVGFAFGLSIAAGLATSLGAAVPFLPCVTPGKTIYLSFGLGLSSGVMLFVSFAEILQEAQTYFCCVTQKHYHLAATAMFFAGAAATYLLHLAAHATPAVRCIRRCFGGKMLQHSSEAPRPTPADIAIWRPATEPGSGIELGVPRSVSSDDMAKGEGKDAEACSTENALFNSPCLDGAATPAVLVADDMPGSPPKETADATSRHRTSRTDAAVSEETSSSESSPLQEHERQRLQRTGLLTGLAIFVHNLPEGLVALIGALANPKLGVALAIAVALHNIPEGIAASAPIYFATGNKKLAFFWGFLSGLSEPIGALLGWLVLRTVMGPAVYGVIFGLVAGMMVYIVVREALPTAHRYDPEDKVVTASMFAGMAVMAVSLLLFDY